MRLALCMILACAGLEASDDRLLAAIGMVESGMNHRAVGDGGRALGAYQMHPEAWQDANAHLKSQGRRTYKRNAWRDAAVQKHMASAYLEVIRTRLHRAGYLSPSPAQLAACWNLGPGGAIRNGLPLTDYAQRVVSIRQSLPCDFRK